MKYEAYHQVYSYTGYELDKPEENTYYTESGEYIRLRWIVQLKVPKSSERV